MFSVILAFALTDMPVSEEWTRFRGPNGQGVIAAKAPTAWSDDKNVRWVADVPAEGWSSPILSGGKIYLTGTTETGTNCHVLAFDAESGKLLWNRVVLTQTPTRKEGKNSFATPTPVIAGGIVYAVFGQGGIVAVNSADGTTKWTFTGISHYSQHGLGASPIIWNNLVIMAYDGSSPGPDKKVGWQTPWDGAILLALDARTGKEVWRGSRGKSRIGHSTPALLTVNGETVLLSQGGDVVQAFNPSNGERLWSVANTGEGLVPSPVIAEGMIITTPGWPTPAIRAWSLTSAKAPPTMVWERTKNVPMLPSTVVVNGLLIALNEKGIVTALELKTGAVIWEERLNGSFSASLVAAGGNVYALNEAGETFVFEAAKTWNLVSRNKLNGVFQATPVLADGRIYLRSDKRLFAIGK
jgi:outer membrane protein assembly factor BamB